MQARSVRRWIKRVGFTALLCGGLPLAASAQNPFATPPAAPSGTAPAAPPAATGNPFAAPPATPAAPAAPAAGSNPFAAPPATAPSGVPSTAPTATPGANPAMPAAPGAPAANPFGNPSTPATPAAPGAPTAPDPFGNKPVAAPVAVDIPIDTVPVQQTVPPGGFRVLAPGVLTTIPNPVSVDDSHSQHDIIEILAVKEDWGKRPNSPSEPAKAVRFEHDVWGLEFSFKPIRYVRIPGPDGKARLIWYMVYRVKNGPVKRYDRDKVPPHDLVAVPVDKPFLFIPRFELESYDVKKTYVDKVIPEAIPLIQQREDKNRKLLTTAEMTGNIEPSTPEIDRSVWGVATWEGVDPRTDRFSIFVHGLTNAYKWADDPAVAYKAGDPVGKGRSYQYQVLKLNFWRPSDSRYEHEEEIRFGIPGAVASEWFYK